MKGEKSRFESETTNVDWQELLSAPMRYADGRNNNWDGAPEETRHL
jgi:hypothetical protein